jgi:glycosyltransferase involved in cell wall biosynthesis
LTTLSAQNLLPSKKEMEEPLNVVIIVTYAHPYIGSGLGVVAKFQAEYLASQGHHVTLVSSNIPRTSKTSVLNGVTYSKVPSLALLERLHIPVPLLFFNRKAVSAIKHADVVHVHDILYPSSFFATLIAKFYKKKVIITQHVPHVYYENKIIDTLEKAVFYTIGLATLWASDAVIVLNDVVYQWVKQYKDEVYYLPNGVDLQLFKRPTEQEKRRIRVRYNIPLDEFVVLFVGRFVPKKGFDILYNAKDPSYLLVFAGGGIIPDSLKIDASVRIIGPLPQEELATLYQASDVFILPSYGEGFPLSIQEAMATGLPIITSKQNNLSNLLDSPLIFYIDRTETDIKAAIKTIQNDGNLRKDMSEYSLKIARKNYSWEKNNTKLLNIYHGKEQLNTAQDPKMVYVTTSWDDGHRLDTRLAQLLQKYGIKGTFYVCPQDREFKREDLLSTPDLLAISKDFEIGGHTITHPHLTKIPIAQADDEIAMSKVYLEEILQREVTAFCYPYGDYNDEVKAIVKKYGYSMARTTKRYAFGIPQDLFAIPTTFHTYAHYSDLPKILPFAQFSLPTVKHLWDWENLAIALFERTCQTGGVFHLWGHSWEIEKNKGWQKLENVLAHIAAKGNVVHQTNTETLKSGILVNASRSL